MQIKLFLSEQLAEEDMNSGASLEQTVFQMLGSASLSRLV